jgi:glycosyltransferase involved in cell wall biosynthesis
MQINNEIGILALVPSQWQARSWRPSHYILSRLARFYKVLWVSPALNYKKVFHPKSFWGMSRGLIKVSPNFWAYTPERYLPLLPTRYGFSSLNGFAHGIRVRRIKSMLTAMGIKRIILYVWRPEFGSYVGEFKEELVCYHVDDEYSWSEIDQPISESERKLLRNSDIVFILSKSLLEKKGKLNSATYYSPMAVDFNHYRQIAEDESIHYNDLSSIPRPRIGYVGIIKKQIDLKLLLEISRERKDWSIVLVGPINKLHKEINETIELLRRESNVYFLGGKKYEELPGYIKDLDVCLMCYRKTAYTKYIFPLKLYEYLACGKPIVSTPLENLEEFQDVLYFADKHNEWIKNIQQSLVEHNTELEQKRIAVARENSWDTRVKDLVSLIRERID